MSNPSSLAESEPNPAADEHPPIRSHIPRLNPAPTLSGFVAQIESDVPLTYDAELIALAQLAVIRSRQTAAEDIDSWALRLSLEAAEIDE